MGVNEIRIALLRDHGLLSRLSAQEVRGQWSAWEGFVKSWVISTSLPDSGLRFPRQFSS